MMSLHVCNLRCWHTCDTYLVCCLKSGCDRSGLKAVLTVGSHSLVRNSRLSCLLCFLSFISPLLSYFICLSHLLSYLAFNTYLHLLFPLSSLSQCAFIISLLLPLLPYIYYSTFIIFHYYLIIAFIILVSLSPLTYIYYSTFVINYHTLPQIPQKALYLHVIYYF